MKIYSRDENGRRISLNNSDLVTCSPPTFGRFLTGVLQRRKQSSAWLAITSGLSGETISQVLRDELPPKREITDKIGVALTRTVGQIDKDVTGFQDWLWNIATEPEFYAGHGYARAAGLKTKVHVKLSRLANWIKQQKLNAYRRYGYIKVSKSQNFTMRIVSQIMTATKPFSFDEWLSKARKNPHPK